MELTLRYDPKIRRSIAAAYIKGSSAAGWLEEINSWGIAPEGLTCLLVPQGRNTLEAAGLFVIFREGQVPDPLKLHYPYGVIAGKLFLPVDATLTPAASEAEFASLLVWYWQLFHPNAGFIGFEKTDRVPLEALVEFPAPADSDWTFAHSGLPPTARLRQISITRPGGNILDTLKDDISSKPLEEIGKQAGERTAVLMRLFQAALLAMLSLLLPMIMLLRKLMSSVQTSSYSPAKSSRYRPGWLTRLEQWISVNIEELEKKRSSEIQRLLKMFDEDTNEALQHAIPLDSPYLNRGTAAPSSRLNRRDTSFSLSNLGGGGRADVWDLGNYHTELRTRYQKAAEKEIEKGNFKKAAYIYAQLLGDFRAAAKVLEQGHQYHEAAALYKDHLNNVPAAAACLEKGGLLTEAIALYKTLHMHERLGDLYTRLEQHEEAIAYYEQSVQGCLDHNDHPGAARIMEQKLQQADKAQHTLLKGWSEGHQAESCLSRYFDMVDNKATNDLELHIQEIFRHKTKPSQRAAFLNVLAELQAKHTRPQIKELATGIAWQLVSKQVASGNHRSVDMLRQFVTDDPLLQPDCNRFISSRRSAPREHTRTKTFSLAKDVKWLAAVAYADLVMVMGIKNTGVYMARVDADLDYDYHMWPGTVPAHVYFAMSANSTWSDQLFIFAGHTAPLAEKILPESKRFHHETVVTFPGWLPQGLLGFIVNKQGGLCTLHFGQDVLTLSVYNRKGALLRSTDCTAGGESIRLLSAQRPVQELLFRNDRYLLHYGSLILLVKEDGETEITDLGINIRKLTASGPYSALRVIAATDKGCVLLRYAEKQLRVVSGFFAEDIAAEELRYMPDNLLVVTGGQTAAVFSLQNNQVEQICGLETDSRIAAILPISRRNHCALLEENGTISLHHIQEL